jgi:hypothetical protein
VVDFDGAGTGGGCDVAGAEGGAMSIVDNDFQFIAARATSEKAAREIQMMLAERLKQFRREVLAQLVTTISKPARLSVSKHNGQ